MTNNFFYVTLTLQKIIYFVKSFQGSVPNGTISTAASTYTHLSILCQFHIVCLRYEDRETD